MCRGSPTREAARISRYLLHHRHESRECGVAFASFSGHESPLRHQPAIGSCDFGGHAIWWTVDAGSVSGALAQLPFFVAERTVALRVHEIQIP